MPKMPTWQSSHRAAMPLFFESHLTPQTREVPSPRSLGDVLMVKWRSPGCGTCFHSNVSWWWNVKQQHQGRTRAIAYTADLLGKCLTRAITLLKGNTGSVLVWKCTKSFHHKCQLESHICHICVHFYSHLQINVMISIKERKYTHHKFCSRERLH